MLSEKLVSVIIPVYNSEYYLEKCIKSIRTQTYQNLEIILVNNCSQDNSLDICLNYVGIDDRIKVLNIQENGVSLARNKGLELANGEFISFIDSDDWVEPNYIEMLLRNSIEYNADISIFENSLEMKKDEVVLMSWEKAIIYILRRQGPKGVVWNKMFSAGLLKSEPRIKFDERIHYCEDTLFVIECLKKARSVVCFKKNLYHYEIHDSSITKSGLVNKKITALMASEKIEFLLQNETALRQYVLMWKAELLRWLQRNLSLDESYKIQGIDLFRKELKNNWIKICLNININIIDKGITGMWLFFPKFYFRNVERIKKRSYE